MTDGPVVTSYPHDRLSRLADAMTDALDKSGLGVALSVAVRVADALGVPLGDLIKPVTCERCPGRPPAGFTCHACSEGAPDVGEQEARAS